MATTNKCFPLVRGRAMRVTALDGCGRPVVGPCASMVTDGFISVALSAQTEEGDAISVTNASGKVCVRESACSTLTGYTAVISFCEVNPAMFAMLSGQQPIYDAQGVAVGFSVNSDISACDSGFALELWSNVPSVQCDPDAVGAQGTFGYLLFPFMQGGTLGDFTIENGAVNFTINGAATKTGSSWANGPYDVVLDASGTAGPLLEPVKSGDHMLLQLTGVAPPAPSCDCTANGTAATGVTPGAPATWTPADSYPAQTLAELTASNVKPTPTTAWTTGQYAVLGDGSEVYWDGTAWEAGKAPSQPPNATGATAGTPGSVTPSGNTAPSNAAQATSWGLTASPTSAWTTGQYIQGSTSGTSGQFFWDGSAWQSGKAS